MAKITVKRKAINKKTLEEVAQENTSATIGTKSNQKVLKEGTPLNHSNMHNINKTQRTVGVNIGITKNMGDFESLRIDCWLTDEILEGETQSDALARVGAIAYNELTRQVEELLDEE